MRKSVLPWWLVSHRVCTKYSSNVWHERTEYGERGKSTIPSPSFKSLMVSLFYRHSRWTGIIVVWIPEHFFIFSEHEQPFLVLLSLCRSYEYDCCINCPLVHRIRLVFHCIRLKLGVWGNKVQQQQQYSDAAGRFSDLQENSSYEKYCCDWISFTPSSSTSSTTIIFQRGKPVGLYEVSCTSVHLSYIHTHMYTHYELVKTRHQPRWCGREEL